MEHKDIKFINGKAYYLIHQNMNNCTSCDFSIGYECILPLTEKCTLGVYYSKVKDIKEIVNKEFQSLIEYLINQGVEIKFPVSLGTKEFTIINRTLSEDIMKKLRHIQVYGYTLQITRLNKLLKIKYLDGEIDTIYKAEF